MDGRVLSPALEQDVVAAPCPSFRESSPDNRSAMPLPAKLAVRDDILEKAVAAPAAQEIWSADQHAGCREPRPRIRDENGHALTREHLGPDAFGMSDRLRDRADFRSSKEVKQRSEIGWLGEPRLWHRVSSPQCSRGFLR